MKKQVLLMILAFLFCNARIAALEKSDVWYCDESISLGASLNFPFIKNTNYNKDIYTAFNVSGAWGFFIHEKPLFKSVKFAVDLGFSADYGRLKEEKLSNACTNANINYPEIEDKHIRFAQINLGLRVGPSIVYRFPNKDYYLNLYAHFIPSISSLVAANEFSLAFVPYNGVGIRFMDDEFGLGVEFIQGKGTFNNIAAEEIKKRYKGNPNIQILDNKYNMKTMMIRLFVSKML